MPDAHPFQDIQSELVESIFSSYMNRADKVVVVMDTGYTVKAINAHGEQVLGHAADEIVGKSWLRSFVSHERREEVRSDYERLLRTIRCFWLEG